MSEVICRNTRRRERVRQQAGLNGLDYLEVGCSDQTKPDLENQKILRVYCFGKLKKDALGATNIRIEGGRRITGIQVTKVKVCRGKHAGTDDDYLEVRVNKPGDFSTYTLRVVQSKQEAEQQAEQQHKGDTSCLNPKCSQPPLDARQCNPTTGQEEERSATEDIPHPGFDQRYNSLDFNFKVNCPNELDNGQKISRLEQSPQEPDLNYLAKDYGTFRRLILDRLSLTMPEWQERHVPDIGQTLVDLMAYVGDHLSYYQDAVGTEAYLNTARRRISLRRHARLVDYTMHEGCNARAWVQLQVADKADDKVTLTPKDFSCITGVDGQPTMLEADDLRQLQKSQYEIFEPLLLPHNNTFWPQHNRMTLYTWGDQECCLPRGATSATLFDSSQPTGNSEQDNSDGKDSPEQSPHQGNPNQHPVEPESPVGNLHLQAGDILILEEVRGPATGHSHDANPRHRHAVRLTQVEAAVDRLDNTPVVEISWAEEDALPFPLCISSLGQAPKCEILEDISIALGNIILVDHGQTLKGEKLAEVLLKQEVEQCRGEGRPAEKTLLPESYRPVLQYAPLTFSQPLALAEKPAASGMLVQDLRQALPQIWLTNTQKSAKETSQPREQAGATSPTQDHPGQQAFLQNTQVHIPKKPEQPSEPTHCSGSSTPPSWLPRADLLASGPDDLHFVVEMDNDGRAQLRFGNDEFGEQPKVGMDFRADYRMGNGPAGNVGAEAISHLVWRNGTVSGANITTVRNPLPAQGGTAAEPMEEVRLFAPRAFRKEQQRAVAAEDYAAIVEREFKNKVQRATARLRWNGSWHEVLISIDPLGQDVADQALLTAISQRLHRYRRIGHDVTVRSARLVPLDIAMKIVVLPTYLRGHVKAALLDVFTDGRRIDGSKGFFHPDNLSFGQSIHLSKLVAAARIAGVEHAEVVRLRRQQIPTKEGNMEDATQCQQAPVENRTLDPAITSGILEIDSFEIALLDHDPNFPENGNLELIMEGGR